MPSWVKHFQRRRQNGNAGEESGAPQRPVRTASDVKSARGMTFDAVTYEAWGRQRDRFIMKMRTSSML